MKAAVETTEHIGEITHRKQPWIELVQDFVESMRFGSVQVLVHDGKVVQIDKLERLRMDKH